jgi:hypothetical protein
MKLLRLATEDPSDMTPILPFLHTNKSQVLYGIWNQRILCLHWDWSHSESTRRLMWNPATPSLRPRANSLLTEWGNIHSNQHFKKLWIIFLNSNSGGWSPTGSTWHVGHQLAYCTCPGDYENGEFCGMMIGKGSRSTRRKSAVVPLCPPQIPHKVTGREPGHRCGKPATNR